MQNLTTMNIRAPKGIAVIAIYENGQVQNGLPRDKEVIRAHIEPEKVYHVDHTVVGDWTTMVYLEEVPGVAFNSVNFKEV